jgi:hypothetical protein
VEFKQNKMAKVVDCMTIGSLFSINYTQFTIILAKCDCKFRLLACNKPKWLSVHEYQDIKMRM